MTMIFKRLELFLQGRRTLWSLLLKVPKLMRVLTREVFHVYVCIKFWWNAIFRFEISISQIKALLLKWDKRIYAILLEISIPEVMECQRANLISLHLLNRRSRTIGPRKSENLVAEDLTDKADEVEFLFATRSTPLEWHLWQVVWRCREASDTRSKSSFVRNSPMTAGASNLLFNSSSPQRIRAFTTTEWFHQFHAYKIALLWTMLIYSRKRCGWAGYKCSNFTNRNALYVHGNLVDKIMFETCYLMCCTMEVCWEEGRGVVGWRERVYVCRSDE